VFTVRIIRNAQVNMMQRCWLLKQDVHIVTTSLKQKEITQYHILPVADYRDIKRKEANHNQFSWLRASCSLVCDNIIRNKLAVLQTEHYGSSFTTCNTWDCISVHPFRRDQNRNDCHVPVAADELLIHTSWPAAGRGGRKAKFTNKFHWHSTVQS
jgi:hypothetical protein